MRQAVRYLLGGYTKFLTLPRFLFLFVIRRVFYFTNESVSAERDAQREERLCAGVVEPLDSVFCLGFSALSLRDSLKVFVDVKFVAPVRLAVDAAEPLAWGGDWGGWNGVDPSALPAVMEIDYVRVFQKF